MAVDRMILFFFWKQKKNWIVQFTLKWHIVHDNSMWFLSPGAQPQLQTHKNLGLKICLIPFHNISKRWGKLLRKVFRLEIITFHTEKEFFSSQQNHKELVKILQRCMFPTWWQWRAWILPDHFNDCQRGMLIWSFCPSFHLFKKSVHWQRNASLTKWPLYCSYKYCPINRKSPCTS